MYKLTAYYPNNQHLTMPNLTFVQCLRKIRSCRGNTKYEVYHCGKLAWEFGEDGIYIVPRFTNRLFV